MVLIISSFLIKKEIKIFTMHKFFFITTWKLKILKQII
jgi:hypothetical protein